MPNIATFLALESEVRSYCRDFPVVFDKAEGPFLYDEDGRTYIDFLCGAASLNYGHNPPSMRTALVDYLQSGGISQALDLHTVTKRRFLERFNGVILAPRGLNYRVHFTGPTGTNAVEAAFKLARKVTGRTEIAAFTGGFHGMTLGALAASTNPTKRKGAGLPLTNVTRLPFEGFYGPDVDTLAIIRKLYDDPSSGLPRPAAFIVEAIQGEGGAIAASPAWLRGIAEIAKSIGALLIVDDIQAGCGRSGQFFGFERAELTPDIVCLSKSISGFGLPMSLALIAPDLDCWAPGEHNGTFRGNTLAFVTAEAALAYWDGTEPPELQNAIKCLDEHLNHITARAGGVATGRGLLRGLRVESSERAAAISREAFSFGVIVETCGADGRTVKFMPPINIDQSTLNEGMRRIETACISTAAATAAA